MAAIALVGCPRALTVETRAAAAPALWADAFAPEGGDGSQRAPFKTLPPSLAPGSEVHLRSGLYRGPFVLAPGSKLVGHGEPVLFVEGEGTVVEGRDVILEALSVQGGTTGARATGRWAISGVHFSGHRGAALEAAEGSEVQVSGSTFEGAVPETTGVHVLKGKVAVSRSTFRGALRRAIDAEGGSVSVTDTVFEGPREALHAEDASSHVLRCSASGGRGPAFFLVRGQHRLEEVKVQGHEYGLQAGPGTTIDVRGFSSKGAQLAGIALQESTATLHHLDLEQSGSLGAVQILGGTVSVDGARIVKAAALGVFVRHGLVSLKHLVIEGVRGEPEVDGNSLGDGVHLRNAEVTMEDVVVRDVEGSALVATAYAQVKLGRLVSERTGFGALIVERFARVVAENVISSGSRGPAVTLPDEATLTIARLEVSGGEVPLWVECAKGASARLGQLVSAVALPASLCIDRGP